MLDFKFNWDSSIETGIAEIDIQHKELFRIGRAVEQLVITRCIGIEDKRVLDIICSLREYVAYHFYEEEHLMELHNISSLEKHREEHNKYRKLIQAIDPRKFNDHPYEQMVKLKDEITELVFCHILGTDKEMSKELLEKMKEVS